VSHSLALNSDDGALTASPSPSVYRPALGTKEKSTTLHPRCQIRFRLLCFIFLSATGRFFNLFPLRFLPSGTFHFTTTSLFCQIPLPNFLTSVYKQRLNIRRSHAILQYIDVTLYNLHSHWEQAPHRRLLLERMGQRRVLSREDLRPWSAAISGGKPARMAAFQGVV
jgi:hypothetical protein